MLCSQGIELYFLCKASIGIVRLGQLDLMVNHNFLVSETFWQCSGLLCVVLLAYENTELVLIHVHVHTHVYIMSHSKQDLFVLSVLQFMHY